MKMNGTQLVMTEKLGPRERRWVTVRPQLIFKAESIFYQGAPGTFKLLDIMVGKNSEFSANGGHEGLSMEVFSKADNQPKFTIGTCQVGMDFKLLIENVSMRDAAFECIVTGAGV